MANEEQLNILRQGVEVWNQWREEHPDEKIDLGEANLFRENLEGANLGGANLYGAFLRGVDLREADLRGADLCRANLCRANLNAADLFRAFLRGADLSEADLRAANLSAANLSEANLYGVKLGGADLRGANLGGANLYGASLIHTNLSKAFLTGACLYGTAHDDWIIDSIKCDFVYWDYNRKDRVPRDRDFRPGEFEELYKHLPTFDYYFKHGFTALDAVVMSRIVEAINEQHPEFELKLDSFHSRGQPHAKFTVLHKEVVEEARKQIAEGYEGRMKVLEGQMEEIQKRLAMLGDQPKMLISTLI